MANDLTPYDVIIRPIITEKSTLNFANSTYTFEVDSRVNKYQVRDAIEKLYNVEVENVRIMNYKGKPKRYGRSEGYTRSFKKAVVKLREGFKIQEFEGLI